jgi:hypothetical protein
MNTYPVTIPEMALVAITRGALGAGLGLLLGEKLATKPARSRLDSVCRGGRHDGSNHCGSGWHAPLKR